MCEEELNKKQMTIDEAFKSNKEDFERGQSQLATKLNELKEKKEKEEIARVKRRKYDTTIPGGWKVGPNTKM